MFLDRIGLVLDLLDEAGFRRFGRHLEDVAVHIDFPAVVKAAQAAFLVAAVDQRRAAVRAEFIEDADPTVGIAEDDEVLAEEPDLDRSAVGLWHFLDQAGRNPMMPEDAAHRRIAFDTAHQVVFLGRQHHVLHGISLSFLSIPTARSNQGAITVGSLVSRHDIAPGPTPLALLP